MLLRYYDSGGLPSEIRLQLDVTVKIGNYLWPFQKSDVLLFSYFKFGLNYFHFLCIRKMTCWSFIWLE